MSSAPAHTIRSKTARHNVRAFTLFRMCFAARFYYPVFAVLYLDHGLSLERFVLLNVLWAATIVLLEIPSGALADTIGRRKLLVVAGSLMVAEMLFLIMAPVGGGPWTFFFFALNRLCGGLAEAAASGADEALAYDSLRVAGEEKSWGRVLERVQRDTSLAFFFALMIGAAVYDVDMVNAVAGFVGWGGMIEQQSLIKVPVLLNLVTAVVALFAALRMREVKDEGDGRKMRGGALAGPLVASWRGTVSAALWTWRSPMAFGIIFAAVLVDSVIRQFLTMASEYWRVIEFPVASFGLIGSAMALLGLFVPAVARRLSESMRPGTNFVLTCSTVFVGLGGLSLAVPYWGIVPAAFLYAAFQLTAYFVSRYLNEVVPSERRATILSFRGLGANLAYGLTGLLYAVLVVRIKAGIEPGTLPSGANSKDFVFVQSLAWFPWYFLATVVVFGLVMRWRCGRGSIADGPANE